MKLPISDPSESPDVDENVTTFHFHFWKTYLNGLTGTLLMVGPLCLFLYSKSLHAPVPLATRSLIMLALIFSIVILANPLGITLTFCMFAIKTTPDFIKGIGNLGAPPIVLWSEIESVRYFWLPFPHVIISTIEKRNVLQVPLVLDDMAAFTRNVEKYTTENNPLRLFLQKRGY